MRSRILIVDDHPLYRDALKGRAELLFPQELVTASGSAEHALAFCDPTAKMRLMIIDFRLPGLTGAAAIGVLRERYPDAPIVVLSASEDRQEASASLRVGASAFISKSLSMPKLDEVLRRAANGEILRGEWHRPDGEDAMPWPDMRPIFGRQREILALLCKELSNKEIAMRLDIAEVTVKMHLTQAFRLLGVVNRSQAIIAVHRLGIELYSAGGLQRRSISPSAFDTRYIDRGPILRNFS